MIPFKPSFFVLVLTLCFAFVAPAHSVIDGDWQGMLDDAKLTMVFHIRVDGKSTVDSPNQHRFGLITDVQKTGNQVVVSLLSAGMTFEGELQGSQIKGVYRQTGSSYPLTLTKRPGSEPPILPSEINGDWQGILPYNSEPVNFHINVFEVSTVDIPSLRLWRRPARVLLDRGTVALTVPGTRVNFHGTLDGSKLAGTYARKKTQCGLMLERQNNAQAQATELFDGDWQGTLPRDNLPVVFHLRLNGRSTTDMPRQHQSDYLIDAKAEGKTLTLSMAGADMRYTGKLEGSSISGTYSQMGSSWPLTLIRIVAPNGVEPRNTSKRQIGNLDGDWQGTITAINYPVLFHLRKDGRSTADNPQNHLTGYQLKVLQDGPHVLIEMIGSGAKFEGMLTNSDLVGMYSQLGSTWPLTLTKTNPGTSAK